MAITSRTGTCPEISSLQARRVMVDRPHGRSCLLVALICANHRASRSWIVQYPFAQVCTFARLNETID